MKTKEMIEFLEDEIDYAKDMRYTSDEERGIVGNFVAIIETLQDYETLKAQEQGCQDLKKERG